MLKGVEEQATGHEDSRSRQEEAEVCGCSKRSAEKDLGAHSPTDTCASPTLNTCKAGAPSRDCPVAQPKGLLRAEAPPPSLTWPPQC